MKKTKSDFRHESIQDTQSVENILQALTEGFKKNELTFSDDEDSIIMTPKGLLNLKILASQDDNDNRINIRISWQTKPSKKKKKSQLKIN